jgi:hypothetical protein
MGEMKWRNGSEVRTVFNSLAPTCEDGVISQTMLSVAKGIEKGSEAQQRDVTAS